MHTCSCTGVHVVVDDRHVNTNAIILLSINRRVNVKTFDIILRRHDHYEHHSHNSMYDAELLQSSADCSS